VTNHETMKCQLKSPTQITKVADTNYLDMSRCLRQSLWQVRDTPVCIALMEFSPLQCRRKVGNKVCDIVRDNCRLVADTNHKSRRHKSRRRLSWFVSATSWRLCHELCCKVGVMEFGLNDSDHLDHTIPSLVENNRQLCIHDSCKIWNVHYT